MDEEQDIVNLSCPSKGTSAKASSIWQHDTRKFGPQHALDSQSMDAWNSAPSIESYPLAYYEIHFQRPVSVREVRVQFQGGFVGMDCTMYEKKLRDNLDNNKNGNEADDDDDDDEWEESGGLFLDTIESNDVQIFPADVDVISHGEIDPCIALRIEFGKSTDFYGRIVIYSLEIWGLELSNK